MKNGLLHYRVALPNGPKMFSALVALHTRQVRIPGRKGPLLTLVVDFYGPGWANRRTSAAADTILRLFSERNHDAALTSPADEAEAGVPEFFRADLNAQSTEDAILLLLGESGFGNAHLLGQVPHRLRIGATGQEHFHDDVSGLDRLGSLRIDRDPVLDQIAARRYDA